MTNPDCGKAFAANDSAAFPQLFVDAFFLLTDRSVKIGDDHNALT